MPVSHHHCFVIDGEGTKLLSRRVANDEPDLLLLIADVLALGDEVIWAIDLADGGAALVIALLSTTTRRCAISPAGP